jgi:hypothetical protein
MTTHLYIISCWSQMHHQAMQSFLPSLPTTFSLLVEHVARISDELACFMAAAAIIAYDFQLLMRFPLWKNAQAHQYQTQTMLLALHRH